MNLTRQEAIYAAIAGAVIGLAYTAGTAAYAGTLAEVAAFELVASAAVGAAAGLLAFAVRKG